MSQPRCEHPRPQFQRDGWLNLNGVWDFGFDFGLSGEEHGWHEGRGALDDEILVPFCPESRLSGICYTDFIPSAWYHRGFEVPDGWRERRILLNFGAVDYDCRVWINGRHVGRHLGGSSAFSLDITDYLQDIDNYLVVNARDDVRSGLQPSGKQSRTQHSQGVHYTRTTGIWQTV